MQILFTNMIDLVRFEIGRMVSLATLPVRDTFEKFYLVESNVEIIYRVVSFEIVYFLVVKHTEPFSWFL